MSTSSLNPHRFTAYKKSVADQHQWGDVKGLTSVQAHNDFPFGKQTEKDGSSYTWCVCLTECYKGNSKSVH